MQHSVEARGLNTAARFTSSWAEHAAGRGRTCATPSTKSCHEMLPSPRWSIVSSSTSSSRLPDSLSMVRGVRSIFIRRIFSSTSSLMSLSLSSVREMTPEWSVSIASKTFISRKTADASCRALSFAICSAKRGSTSFLRSSSRCVSSAFIPSSSHMRRTACSGMSRSRARSLTWPRAIGKAYCVSSPAHDECAASIWKSS